VLGEAGILATQPPGNEMGIYFSGHNKDFYYEKTTKVSRKIGRLETSIPEISVRTEDAKDRPRSERSGR